MQVEDWARPNAGSAAAESLLGWLHRRIEERSVGDPEAPDTELPGSPSARPATPRITVSMPGEWDDADRARPRARSVHAEEVTHVLRDVELTGDVLDTTCKALADEGIIIDEAVDEADDDDPPSAMRRREVVARSTTSTTPTSDCSAAGAAAGPPRRRRRGRHVDVGRRADVPARDRPGRPADRRRRAPAGPADRGGHLAAAAHRRRGRRRGRAAPADARRAAGASGPRAS